MRSIATKKKDAVQAFFNKPFFYQGKTGSSGSGRQVAPQPFFNRLGAGPTIQRTPDEDKKEATRLKAEILADPAFKALNALGKKRAKAILKLIDTKPLGSAKGQQIYYLKKLKIAITTPSNAKASKSGGYGCSPDMEKKNRAKVDSALAFEKTLNFSDFLLNTEERAVASGTNKTERVGQGGKKFYVDRSDPRFIRVKIKVKLNGKPEDVAKIHGLEDAIERQSYTRGYFLDIEFVTKSGPDVFEFTVNFCQWPNSGNWASSPTTLSHEVHHALGLKDRYDYIEVHAANKNMDVPSRLKWFKVQMGKTLGARDPHSKMARSSKQLLSEDVCAVAFTTAAERKKCIEARKDLDPAGIPAH